MNNFGTKNLAYRQFKKIAKYGLDPLTIARALDVEHPTATGGPLDRRGTMTMVHVEMSSNPNKTINRCLEGQLESDDLVGIKSQAVIYSNSKTNTEGSLLTDATKICKKLYSIAKVCPDAVKIFTDSLTGGDAIK